MKLAKKQKERETSAKGVREDASQTNPLVRQTAGRLTERPKKFLAYEIWDNIREVIAALIEHITVFFLFPLSVVVLHYLIWLLHLPERYRQAIDFFEFVTLVLAFVIFSAGFIMKLFVFTFRRRNDGHSAE